MIETSFGKEHGPTQSVRARWANPILKLSLKTFLEQRERHPALMYGK
jgi:hypothetical protein